VWSTNSRPSARRSPWPSLKDIVPTAARPERASELRCDIRERRRRHMQQRRAGPDTVELPVPRHIVEAHEVDVSTVAQPGAGEPHHLLGGVEGDHLVATFGEGQSIPLRPTAGVRMRPPGRTWRRNRS
jgi:hypothetical protein